MNHLPTGNKAIMVRCNHCGGYYLVAYSPVRMVLSRYLDYSVCDICDKPRRLELWVEGIKHCSICHLPLEKQGSSTVYCETHYMQYYRERRRFRCLLQELLSHAREFLDI